MLLGNNPSFDSHDADCINTLACVAPLAGLAAECRQIRAHLPGLGIKCLNGPKLPFPGQVGFKAQTSSRHKEQPWNANHCKPKTQIIRFCGEKALSPGTRPLWPTAPAGAAHALVWCPPGMNKYVWPPSFCKWNQNALNRGHNNTRSCTHHTC